MSFDPVRYARDEIGPTLEAICKMADHEGEKSQHDFFASILDSLRHSETSDDLAEPFMALSTTAFRGFVFSPAQTLLIDDALEKAQNLAQSLALGPDDLH